MEVMLCDNLLAVLLRKLDDLSRFQLPKGEIH